MNRRRFLNSCQALGAILVGRSGWRLAPVPAALSAGVSGGERRQPKIKVFGAGHLGWELIDYSRKYAPDGANRQAEHILLGDLIQDCPLECGWSENVQESLHDRRPRRASPLLLEALRRFSAYVADADILVGIGDLGERTDKTWRLMTMVSRLADARKTLRIAIVTFPHSFEWPHVNRAYQQLEKLKAEYDAVVVIPKGKVLERVGEELTLSDACVAVDQYLHRCVMTLCHGLAAAGARARNPGELSHLFTSSRGATGIGAATGSGAGTRAAIEALEYLHIDDSAHSGVRCLLVQMQCENSKMFLARDEAESELRGRFGSDVPVMMTHRAEDPPDEGVQVSIVAMCEPKGKLAISTGARST